MGFIEPTSLAAQYVKSSEAWEEDHEAIAGSEREPGSSGKPETQTRADEVIAI